MDYSAHSRLVSFIWSIADDCIRDVYVKGRYRDVILPMVVLRRLDTLLEPTKDKVLADVKYQISEMESTEHDDEFVLDGVYTIGKSDKARFHRVKAPNQTGLQTLLNRVIQRVVRRLQKRFAQLYAPLTWLSDSREFSILILPRAQPLTNQRTTTPLWLKFE